MLEDVVELLPVMHESGLGNPSVGGDGPSRLFQEASYSLQRPVSEMRLRIERPNNADFVLWRRYLGRDRHWRLVVGWGMGLRGGCLLIWQNDGQLFYLEWGWLGTDCRELKRFLV